MQHNYKRTTYISVAVAVVSLLVTIGVMAGSVDSPGGPTDAGSQMYTLEQIYDLLTTGTRTDKMTTFSEPSSAPGTGTMHTLDEIMTAAQDNRCHCECAGCTLNGTRWCDNGDGTVTDLLGHDGVGQCLVWAKDASWGGTKPWRNSSTDCSHPNYTCSDDAHKLASAYGLETENWRLPTLAELHALTHGTELTLCGYKRKAGQNGKMM